MRALLAFVLVVSSAASAQAGAMPAAPVPVPLPGVLVYGPAVLEDVSIDVDCAGTDLVTSSASCHVEARAIVRALEPVEIQLPEGGALIDGEPTLGSRHLEGGAQATVELSFDRALSQEVRDSDMPWFISGNRARHIVLGESTSLRRTGDWAGGDLFGGVQLTVAGPMRVDATGAGEVTVMVASTDVHATATIDGERAFLDLSIEGGPVVDPVFQHGGPFLGAGIWGDIDLPEPPFAMRAGWEVALVDFVILSLAIETDFDSMAESLLVEVASPELLVIFPSFSAGVGVVARQLGQRDADAAIRLAMGYQLFSVGAYVDFDYWPVIDGWTLAAGARISI